MTTLSMEKEKKKSILIKSTEKTGKREMSSMNTVFG